MLAIVTIDPDGAVTVEINTDEAEGDDYAPDVACDMASRAGAQALTTWLALRSGSGQPDEG